MTDPSSVEQSAERRPYGLRLALLAGVLLWLSCPAANLWPLAWIAVCPLILSISRAGRFRQALWRGYIFGWVYLGIVWYWTGTIISSWTHSAIGWVAWFALTLLLALFYALWAGFAWLIWQSQTGWRRVIGIAAAWTAMEYLRTVGTIGMPWAQVSYTQTLCLPMIQIADITGAVGVSFLVVLFNAALADYWSLANPRDWKRSQIPLAAATAAIACLYGIFKLFSPVHAPTIVAAAMQPNFHATGDTNTLRDLSVISKLTQEAQEHQNSAGSDPISLFVWPEGASPGDAVNDNAARSTLISISEHSRAALTTGSQVVEPRSRKEYNSSVLFTPDGAEPQRYDKQHLVPFGEFIPFRSALPEFLDSTFQFPPTDIVPGSGNRPLNFVDLHGTSVSLGPFICYESVYPAYARHMATAGANLLINQSNDDWLQSDSGIEQHLSAVVMRAVENRRDTVRSTSTGITCIIDSRGRRSGAVPTYSPGYVVKRVHLLSDKSLYTRLGDWFPLSCILFTALLIYGSRIKKVVTH